MDNITYHPKAILKKSESLTTWESHLRSKANDLKHRELDLIQMRREVRFKEIQIDAERKKHLLQTWLTFFIGMIAGAIIGRAI
jgi:hypothetical protein